MSDPKFNPSITALNDCVVACEVCAASCLQEKDIHNLVDCIRSDLDCAAICRVTVSALARGSEYVRQLCAVCAEICAHCAEHCEMHDHDHCRACARACRRAQEECAAIAA